jgi:gliding motility-associated-like protein
VTITTNAIDTYKLHFNWDFGDSSYFNKPNPISHNYKKIGTYAISLKVTNDYCPKYEYALLGDSISIINPLDSSKFTMFLLSDQDTLLTPKRIDTGYTQYTWMPGFNLSNPNIANPIFRGNQSIDYILMRVDPNTGCKIYDTYIMDVSNNVVVAIPKAFTPNNDNLNDVLKIEFGAGVSALNTFSIYNRFGKMVFQTNDITRGWDGKFNGIDQDMDAYTYYIDYVTYKGVNMRKSGSFVLIR